MLPAFEVRTARLTLRPLVASDRQAFLRYQSVSRDHLAPWLPLRAPGMDDAALFDDQLRRASEGLAAETDVRLSGFLADGRLAAQVALGQIFRRAFESAYAGWSVSADCVGAGLATEAVHGLLDIAFAPPPRGIGLHRVQANIMPANARSIRVAEKCGFRREGVARAYLRIAGRWEDHVMFAKLSEEHAG